MSVAEAAPESNVRLIFPYGACKDESTIFSLLDAGLVPEGEERAAAVDEAARLCIDCDQYAFCSAQRPQIGESMWAAGIGSLVVGAQEVPLTAGSRSAVRMESTALEFDLSKELSDDPDERLFILRQAIRAGQIPLAKRRPAVAETAAAWFEERAAANNPDVYEGAQTIMGPEAVTHALRMIAGAAVQLRLAGVKTQSARGRRSRDIENGRQFEEDEAMAVYYLDDVAKTWQFLDGLSSSNRGDFAKLAHLRLPTLLLNHSLEFVQELYEQNRGRYPEVSELAIRRAICEHPVDPQPSIDVKVAEIAVDRSASYRQLGRVSSGRLLSRAERGRKLLAGERSDHGYSSDSWSTMQAVVNANRERHPYLDDYFNTAIKRQPDDPTAWLQSLVDSVETTCDALIETCPNVERQDAAYFLSQYPYSRARRAIERFALIHDKLVARYEGHPDYGVDLLRSLSRQAVVAGTDPDLYFTHLDILDHDADNDGSATPINLHRYARHKQALSYDQVKRLHMAESVWGKFDRNRGGHRYWIKRWMIQNIADQYPLNEIKKTADHLYEAMWRGFLGSMATEVNALQPAPHQALAAKICSPNGEYVTFRPRLWAVEPADRLAFAAVWGLDQVLYGERLDTLALSAILGVRDLDEYWHHVLRDKLEHAAEHGETEWPSGLTTLGGLHQDLAFFDSRLRELGIRGSDDHADDQSPVMSIDTVVGAELVATALPDWQPADTGLSAAAHGWLMHTVPRLYAPRHQGEVLSSVRQLLEQGVIVVEPQGNSYGVVFNPALLNPTSGLADIELAVIAAAERIDLLTHGGDIASLLRERIEKAQRDRTRTQAAAAQAVQAATTMQPKTVRARRRPQFRAAQPGRSEAALAAAATGAAAHAHELVSRSTAESLPRRAPEAIIETSLVKLLSRAPGITAEEIAAAVDRCLPAARASAEREPTIDPGRVTHLLGLVGTVYSGYLNSAESKRRAATGRVAAYAMQQLFGNGPRGGRQATGFNTMYAQVADQAELLGMGRVEEDIVLRYIANELEDFVRAAGLA